MPQDQGGRHRRSATSVPYSLMKPSTAAVSGGGGGAGGGGAGATPFPSSSSRRRANTDTVKLLMLGYRQELRREFTLLNCMGASVVALNPLGLAGPAGLGVGFLYGGPVVMMWGWPVVTLFSASIGISMAELASAYPTSGALYYWSYRLAHPRLRTLACWMTAWTLTLGQAAFSASTIYTVVEVIQAALVSQYDVVLTPLQRLGVLSAVIVVIGALNCGSPRLTAFMTTVGTLWGLLAGLVFSVTLVLIAPRRQSFKYVFTSWEPHSEVTGISSPLYIILVGLLMSQWIFTGYDGSAHWAEETFNAEYTVPYSILLAIAAVGVVGYLFLGALTFARVDPSIWLGSETGGDNVVLEVLKQVTGLSGSSVASAVALFSVPLLSSFFCGYQGIANNSRMLYAFARDNGVPLSRFAKQVHPVTQAPVYGVLYMLTLAAVLAVPMCFNVYVFPVITSLAVMACYAAYVIPILCKLSTGRRFWLAGPFHLGPTLSYINNLISAAWVLMIMAIATLPSVYPVTAANCNWSGPSLVACMSVQLACFFFPRYGARHWFLGPRANLGRFKDVLPSEVAVMATPGDPRPPPDTPPVGEAAAVAKRSVASFTSVPSVGSAASADDAVATLVTGGPVPDSRDTVATAVATSVVTTVATAATGTVVAATAATDAATAAMDADAQAASWDGTASMAVAHPDTGTRGPSEAPQALARLLLLHPPIPPGREVEEGACDRQEHEHCRGQQSQAPPLHLECQRQCRSPSLREQQQQCDWLTQQRIKQQQNQTPFKLYRPQQAQERELEQPQQLPSVAIRSGAALNSLPLPLPLPLLGRPGSWASGSLGVWVPAGDDGVGSGGGSTAAGAATGCRSSGCVGGWQFGTELSHGGSECSLSSGPGWFGAATGGGGGGGCVGGGVLEAAVEDRTAPSFLAATQTQALQGGPSTALSGEAEATAEGRAGGGSGGGPGAGLRARVEECEINACFSRVGDGRADTPSPLPPPLQPQGPPPPPQQELGPPWSGSWSRHSAAAMPLLALAHQSLIVSRGSGGSPCGSPCLMATVDDVHALLFAGERRTVATQLSHGRSADTDGGAAAAGQDAQVVLVCGERRTPPSGRQSPR